MKKLRYRALFFILTIFASGGVYLYFYKYRAVTNPKQAEEFKEKKKELTALLEASSRLNKLWKEGMNSDYFPRGMSCSKFFNLNMLETVHNEYTKCNPRMIECLLEGENVEGGFIVSDQENEKRRIKLFPFSQSQKYEVIYPGGLAANDTSKRLFHFQIIVDQREVPLHLYFVDDCHQVLLPQRKYAFGPDLNKGTEWDNFNQNILIDKNLVTVGEFVDWYISRFKGELEKISYLAKISKATPVFGLGTNMMDLYCADHRGVVMRSEIFEAASFFPMDLEEEYPMKIFRTPYPWTNRSSPQNEVLKDCNKLYALECRGQKNREFYTTSNISWMGMRDVVGGPLEYLENMGSQLANIKSASFYFPANSRFNQLQTRANWTGKDFFINSMSFADQLTINEPLQVGFRCMHYVD